MGNQSLVQPLTFFQTIDFNATEGNAILEAITTGGENILDDILATGDKQLISNTIQHLAATVSQLQTDEDNQGENLIL